jgi:hypothetical protein
LVDDGNFGGERHGCGDGERERDEKRELGDTVHIDWGQLTMKQARRQFGLEAGCGNGNNCGMKIRHTKRQSQRQVIRKGRLKVFAGDVPKIDIEEAIRKDRTVVRL